VYRKDGVKKNRRRVKEAEGQMVVWWVGSIVDCGGERNPCYDTESFAMRFRTLSFFREIP
jgi:hypothetical protein